VCLASELAHEEAGLVVGQPESLHLPLVSTKFGGRHWLLLSLLATIKSDVESIKVLVLTIIISWGGGSHVGHGASRS
jgi:hypothetical protein